MGDEPESVHIVIETENVIAAVRSHRLLWDPSHDLYTGKEARRRAWSEICRTLMPDWDNFDDQDQIDIERKVQQRWRTARDCYVKARAARQTPRARASRRENALRSYTHYDRLGFLEETLRAPGTVTLPRAAPAAGARRSRRPRRRSPGADPLPAPVAAEAGCGDDDDDDDGTLSVFERRLLATLRARVGGDSPLEPDDEHFFRSLAPMLAVLDHSQKLQFRSTVLDELQRQYRDHIEPYDYVSVNERRPDDDDDDDDDRDDPPDKKYRPSAYPAHDDDDDAGDQ